MSKDQNVRATKKKGHMKQAVVGLGGMLRTD